MADTRPARPGPLLWLRYAYGGALPSRYREWVLRDVTAPRWWWRQLVRALVQALPVGLVVGLLIPGPLWVRVMAVAGGVFVAMIYVIAFLDEAVEYRAIKAGFPRGYAQSVRDAAVAPHRDAAAQRYAERYRSAPTDPPAEGSGRHPVPWSDWSDGGGPTGRPPGWPSGPPSGVRSPFWSSDDNRPG